MFQWRQNCWHRFMPLIDILFNCRTLWASYLDWQSNVLHECKRRAVELYLSCVIQDLDIGFSAFDLDWLLSKLMKVSFMIRPLLLLYMKIPPPPFVFPPFVVSRYGIVVSSALLDTTLRCLSLFVWSTWEYRGVVHAVFNEQVFGDF